MTLRVVTVKPSAGDYSSQNAAAAGEATDLPAADRQLRIDCYNFVDTAAVSFPGASWNVDTTRFPTVNAVDNHGGLFGGAGGTSAYSLQVSGNWAIVSDIGGPLNLTGLSISSDTNGALLRDFSAGTVARCIGRGTDSATHVWYTDRSSTLGIPMNFESCLALVNGSGGGSRGFYMPDITNCRDCTAIGGDSGFYSFGGACVVKNCLASGSGVCFDSSGGGSYTSTNCASSDASASGTGARINQTFTFVNAGAQDYHLAAGDAGAKGFGADLTSDGVTVDIDNQAIASPWNIGADQFAPSGGGSGTTIRDNYEPTYYDRGWFDPTLRAPGWFDEDWTDLLRVVSAAIGAQESVVAAASTRAGNHEAVTQASRAIAGNEESLVGASKTNAGVEESTGGLSKSTAGDHEAVGAIAKTVQGNHEAVTRASSQRIGAEESTFGLVKTTAGVEESTGFAASSKAGQHEALTRATSTRAGNEESLIGASRSTSGNEESNVGASSSVAGKEESLVGASRALAGDHESLAGAARAIAGTEESLARASSQKTGTEESIAKVAQTATGEEESTLPASASATGRYEALTHVAAPTTGQWEAQGITTTPVSASATSQMEALVGVAKSTAGDHEAVARATSSRTGQEESVAGASSSRTGAQESTRSVSTSSTGSTEQLVGLRAFVSSVMEGLARIARAIAGAWENYPPVVFKTPHAMRAVLGAVPRLEAEIQTQPRAIAAPATAVRASASLATKPRATAVLAAAPRLTFTITINGVIPMTTRTATPVRINASNVIELSKLTDILAPSTPLTSVTVSVKIVGLDGDELTPTTSLPAAVSPSGLYAVTLSKTDAAFQRGVHYIAQFSAAGLDADSNSVDYYEEIELVGTAN